MWVSILFSMLSIAARLGEVIGLEKATPKGKVAPTQEFLNASAQCLVLGNIGKPKPYTLPALQLYAQSRYMTSLDPVSEVWTIFGIIVRVALRMGYHRDPTHFPDLTPFDGEMRRRNWALIRQFDLMISFQMGLPSSIQEDQCDTEPPRNLLDSDFDELSWALPASRPESQATEILYFVVKSRMMDIFGKIVRQALSLRPVSYESVMKLDSELQQAYATIPANFKMRPMAQSFADPARLIMVRLNCDLFYLKSKCVLHRKYSSQSQSHLYSREACIKAAMQMLEHQTTVHQESQLGGQLYQDRWMVSSMLQTDFLLAAVILCVDLSESCTDGINDHGNADAEVKYRLLLQSYAICSEQRDASKEAARVSDAMAVMLTRLKPLFPDSAANLPFELAQKAIITHTPSSGSSEPLQGLNEGAYVGTLLDSSEKLDWVRSCFNFATHNDPRPQY